ncbi:MAG: hypothetical protein RIS44_1038 [Pseudomonadota bacterium]|jgi:hypothetical protein
MNKRSTFRVVAAITLALTTGLALASGTDGGGAAETGDAAAYNTGKGVYASKFGCGTCPMAGKSLDAGSARELLANKKGVSLSAEESAALEVYLKRRFKL